MKGLTQTKVLQIAEAAAQSEVSTHFHDVLTNLFVKSVTVTTTTKEVVTDVVIDGGVLTQTKETISYVSSVAITLGSVVTDVLDSTETSTPEVPLVLHDGAIVYHDGEEVYRGV